MTGRGRIAVSRIVGCRVILCAIAVGYGGAVRAAQYVPPPQLPLPNSWQGRSQAVIRVLDKLDAHIQTLTLKPGETGSYKSLAVTVRSCMDHPDGLQADAGAFLDIQDKRGDTQPFDGWMFSGEPSVGVFESPVYGVQLVTCEGDLAAPAAPPLPPLPAPPVAMGPAVPAAPPADAPPADIVPPADGAVGNGAEQPAPGPAPDPGSNAPPDPVYPSGPPPASPDPSAGGSSPPQLLKAPVP